MINTTIRLVKENPEGYDENSKDFMEALAQAKKQFEMQIYPNKNHGIYGGNPSIHLYTRMTDFILENL